LQSGKTLREPTQDERDELAKQIAPLFEKAQALGKLYASKQLERALFATIGGWLQRATELVGRAVDWAKSLFESRVEDLGDDASEDDLEEAASLVADTVAETLAPTEIQSIIEETVLDTLTKNDVVSIVWVTEPDACQICEDNESQGAIPIGQAFKDGSFAPPSHQRCRCHISIA